MKSEKTSVVVLYNYVGEDEYEKMKTVDPASLEFQPEYDIHVSTAKEEYDAVAKALRKEGFRARSVNVREDIRVLERLLKRNPPDVIFNLVEHFNDESRLESAVAGLFELYQIPFTGAPPFALAMCQRKGLTKQVLLANGVPTPKYKSLMEPSIPRRHGLHYPLIVKPAREDASSGVEKSSVVYDYQQLMDRLKGVLKEYNPPILVEEYIEGRELHVSVFGNENPVVFPMIEFDFSGLPADHPNIISYDAKWNPLDEIYHKVHTICPAIVSKREKKKIEEVAIKAYQITGCRDYARFDIRLSEHNHVYVLEVNPNPDLTEGVSYMESAEQAGHSFSETLRMIVEFALKRKQLN